MRVFVSLVLGAMVLGLAFWAYQENYRTRETVAEMRRMEAEIGRLNERLSVLRAEWAYLNRPERLRDLAELNFERLGLLPLSPDHFGQLDQVSFPARPIPQAMSPDAAVPARY
ncbi:MAG: cell division protein FtsL [Qingshengfaniella sp.]